MDEVLDRIIKQSGAMWETVRERWDAPPVLVKTSLGPFGNVYELSLPKGEHHPFWRVTERPITDDEAEAIQHARMARIGSLDYLEESNPGTGFRVRAFVYNGRHPHGWLVSMERVRVTIERIEVE